MSKLNNIIMQAENLAIGGSDDVVDTVERAKNEYARLLAIADLMPKLIEPTRQPAKIGGGVVMKCKHCNGTWWLDELDEIHLDPNCLTLKARKLIEEKL